MTISQYISYINSSIQHKHVYHFTDPENIPLIRKYGLLCKDALAALGIVPPRPGGDDLSRQLDQERGISGYISLCLTRNHPMAYCATQRGGISHPRYLYISPNVLALPGVKISLGVANANGAAISPLEDALGEIDYEVIYTRTDWRDPQIKARLDAAEKFEVLVPGRIGLEHIVWGI